MRKRQVRGSRTRWAAGADRTAATGSLVALRPRIGAPAVPTTTKRHQLETREEQNDDESALEKIRELARRQDALNRQQQELAKSATDGEEELRRELEKLTREQTELRRQAEELSRQMQQKSQQAAVANNRVAASAVRAGRAAERREQPDAARGVRGHAERRKRPAPARPDAASARGNRALDKLRDVEQRMRRRQPDDRRRALGELQLESRQLADARASSPTKLRRRRAENRRVPLAQVRRVSQMTMRDAVARGEQERLAERMQRLEQSVPSSRAGAEGARGATDDERKAGRGGARRRTAEALRAHAERRAPERAAGEGTRDQRAALVRAGHRQAGRAAAERLGAASGQSAEARRLSEQLARTRELPRRIGEVDRQLSEMRPTAIGGAKRQTPTFAGNAARRAASGTAGRSAVGVLARATGPDG